MKKFLSIILLLCLVGCVQTSSKKPLIGNLQQIETISMINLIPDEIRTFQVGITVFQNKLIKQNPEDWDISHTVGERVSQTLSNVTNVEIQELALDHGDFERLLFKDKERLAAYEKRIQNIPNILKKARSQNSDKLALILPSTVVVNVHNVEFLMRGIGLLYSKTGAIVPFTAISIYLIDTKTNEIIGRHDLEDIGQVLKLENDLPNTTITKITKKFEKEQQRRDNQEGAGFQIALKTQLAMECGKMERYADYNETNKSIVKSSLIQSLDRTVSQLKNIYFGTPILKDGAHNILYVRAFHSCQI